MKVFYDNQVDALYIMLGEEKSKAYFAEMRSLWERFSSYPVLQT